ncbi:Telomeric repeat-binding factor 2 [Streptomyces lavendulae subsp. lavendulae]|uniref:Telomeric repeat-binding factor 2 n=2 Tax=Streptomyces lavendulae TaxID=1914 RepID=A0A2K8PJP3_STRLA|nr:DUF4352 domain-containing protein [Streptomyces lavendulae]ATZ26954.1 Telomeric repeat-binding factor 2 [Streptomyces lavendulae subsp. lavendulae]QUQ56781.1 hypothetical protein SLLC_23940 [Streptomyces lavendulae subsp. lavendulae]
MSNPYPGQTPPPPYGYPVPPQPPKKNNVGKIIGIGCGGLIGLSLLLAACGAIIGGNDAFKKGAKDGAKSVSMPAVSAPAAAPPGSAPAASGTPASKPVAKQDVELTATPAEFNASVLAQGDDYTSVQVTVVNNGDKEVSVNILYFEVTAADGTRKTAELGAAGDQIDTVTLAKGEKVTGAVTVKGKITAKTVYFKNGLLGKSYSTSVK